MLNILHPLGVLLVMHLSREEGKLWQSDMSRRQLAHTTRTGDALIVKHFAPLDIEDSKIISTTGAGDSLVGSLLSNFANSEDNIWLDPSQLEESMQRAQRAAILSLQSGSAVSPLLSANQG